MRHSGRPSAGRSEDCAEQENAGRPIGENDLHIAAHARSEGLILVTNNVGEFERVPGLLQENWVVVLKELQGAGLAFCRRPLAH